MSDNIQTATVSCTKLQIASGDRILVKCYHDLNSDQIKRIERSIRNWAGVPIEVLVYDGRAMDVIHQSGNKEIVLP